MEAQDISCQPKKYTCSHEKCGYQTNKLFNFQRHRKIHEKKAQLREMAAQAAAQGHLRDGSPSAKIQRLDTFHIECSQAGCPFSCEHMEDFIDHVQSSHEKDLKFIVREFADKPSLESFMKSLQDRTSCQLMLSRTFDNEVGESFELCCAHSGQYRRSMNGGVERSANRGGIYCTFYLNVTVIDGIIKVRGCESHFGHRVDFNDLSVYNNNNNLPSVATQLTPTTTSTPTPPTPTMPMQLKPSTPMSLQMDRSVKTDESSSISPDSSRSSRSHNISPIRDDLIKGDVKDECLQDPVVKRDFNSELRRVALDLQTEAELFMESEGQLAEQEFNQIEKASAAIIEILRRARSRPQPTVPLNNNPVGGFATASTPQINAAILQNHQQIQQLQQLLRESGRSNISTSAMPLLNQQPLVNTIPQLNLLLTAAAAQQRPAFGQQLLGQNNIAANVLTSLANSIQQQQSQAGLLAVSQSQQTAVVPPQPQLAGNGLGLLQGQNQRFEELVRKAIIELDSQRRSTCAQCHRKDPLVQNGTERTAWLECQRCNLKYHGQCVSGAQCVKCKNSMV
ncbi:unnamed protein product [Bursaphelenchus xylophilus]|uniref:(pine wood nematode) hypothetical protein n=1 Tax=Bursaphelenchus xylophilus TaxID=6326 RepID=A0A1I7RN04_BURXY|nr:unnamed protein product [Bursaphelenchus xylophilus]CAG9125296.1 unnamed protein product [Bursaphelenchus xylophilus]